MMYRLEERIEELSFLLKGLRLLILCSHLGVIFLLVIIFALVNGGENIEAPWRLL